MRSAAQRAIENVRECGAQMGARAQALRAASPNVRMSAAERTRTLALCDQLSAVADEVASGVSGLDAVNADGTIDVPQSPGLGLQVDERLLRRYGKRFHVSTPARVALHTIREKGLKAALQLKKAKQIA